MQIASYVGTRKGIMLIGSILIRLRLSGIKQAFKMQATPDQKELRASHTELVFEPDDNVGYLMPDGTCQADQEGMLWCLSSVGAEVLPPWSNRRAGKIGGVRLKRINVNTKDWQLQKINKNALPAAKWARANEGLLYDWQLILGFIAWFIPNKTDRLMCNECVLTVLDVEDAFRFDPCSTQILAKYL